MKIVVDGNKAIFGRMSSFVAKSLLKGDSVDVINCENIIVSGRKEVFVKKILERKRMGSGGSLKGPKYIFLGDRLVKRMIRGMLPWDRAKGRDAFRRLKCHIGNGDLKEDELKDVKTFNHRKLAKFSTIGELVRLLRGAKNE